MDLLAAIRAHGAARARIAVTVPEWGGAVLYFPEDLTLNEKALMEKSAGASSDEASMMAAYVARHAQNEDGTKAFPNYAEAMATLLQDGRVKVLMSILAQIGAPETVDAAKND